MEEEDQIPLFQKSIVKEFMQIQMPGTKIAGAFTEKFNKSLTLFTLYLYHIIKLTQQKKKTISHVEIIAALKEMNFADIATQLETNPFPVEQIKEALNVQEDCEIID